MTNPVKITLKSEIISLVLLLANIFASFYFFKHFPEMVPTHWNFSGEVDSWSSSFMAAFLFPLIIVLIYLLFLALPFLDPKKERYIQFSRAYNVFKSSMIVFLTVIYFAASLSAVGFNINITRAVTVSVGILFIIMGNYLSTLLSEMISLKIEKTSKFRYN